MESSPTVSTGKPNGKRVEYIETFERNFITQARAINEFLLKPSHLENLTKYVRRSPFESDYSIVVFRRKDVELK